MNHVFQMKDMCRKEKKKKKKKKKNFGGGGGVWETNNDKSGVVLSGRISKSLNE